MVIKNLTKKVILTTAMASSLVILPQLGPTHHASAATVTISTTHQIIENGSQGPAVKSLQTRLNQLGYFSYRIDGIYGPLTKSSVKKYQQANHLMVDGIAGPNTLGKLFNSSSSTPSVSTASNNVMSIKSIQSKLKSLGYYTDAIDGIFGVHSRAAVIAFQKNNHLVVDGIPGPNTQAKLASSSAVKATAVSTPTASSSTKGATASSLGQSTSTRTAVKTVVKPLAETVAKPVIKTSSLSSISKASQIIADAKALQGIPYVYGGTTPGGFDCSGFTQYVFRENGITLPRIAAEQYAGGKPTNLVPGVLVFFSTVSAGASHAGIYIGNNEFISATSSSGVEIASMDNPYWKPRYLGARAY